MESFEELARVAYPLYAGCVGEDPSKWELSDDEMELVDRFVFECIQRAMETVNIWQQ